MKCNWESYQKSRRHVTNSQGICILTEKYDQRDNNKSVHIFTCIHSCFFAKKYLRH